MGPDWGITRARGAERPMGTAPCGGGGGSRQWDKGKWREAGRCPQTATPPSVMPPPPPPPQREVVEWPYTAGGGGGTPPHPSRPIVGNNENSPLGKWHMMTFLNPLDALISNIPFSFFFGRILGPGRLRGAGVRLGRSFGGGVQPEGLS